MMEVNFELINEGSPNFKISRFLSSARDIHPIYKVLV